MTPPFNAAIVLTQLTKTKGTKMLKKDVIAYYGNSVSAVARALGINHAAVSQWGEVVPMLRAYQVESLTKRRLKVDPKLYVTAE